MAKQKSVVEVAADVPLADDLQQNMQKMAALQGAYNDDRDLVNQLLGQAQMAGAFAKFSQTVWTSKLAYVKENKLYQSFKGTVDPNGLELNGTWIEFCNLLGISDEKANQDITNLKTFGEDALESMSRMGIGYRELRQYRRLPEDQKAALIEVAKQGDKDTLLELAEDLIARHAKEKEALTSKAEKAIKARKDAEDTLAASNQRYQSLKQKKDALEDQRDQLQEKLNNPYANLTADEKTGVFEVSALSAVSMVKDALAKLGGVFKEMRDDETDRGVSHDAAMAKAAFDIREALENLLSGYMVPEFTVADKRPAWLDGSAD